MVYNKLFENMGEFWEKIPTNWNDHILMKKLRMN